MSRGAEPRKLNEVKGMLKGKWSEGLAPKQPPEEGRDPLRVSGAVLALLEHSRQGAEGTGCSQEASAGGPDGGEGALDIRESLSLEGSEQRNDMLWLLFEGSPLTP